MHSIKQIQVSLELLMIKAGLLENVNEVLAPLCAKRSALLVSDSNVDFLIIKCSCPKFILPAGGKNKTIDTVTAAATPPHPPTSDVVKKYECLRLADI